MAQHITVKSGRTDAKVVLSERDPAHPDGEAYVAASEGPDGKSLVNPPVTVGRTALVDELLHRGELVLVTADRAGRAIARAGEEDLSDEERAERERLAEERKAAEKTAAAEARRHEAERKAAEKAAAAEANRPPTPNE